MRRSKLVLVVVLVALVVAFFAFDLQQFFSLEYLKSRQTDLGSYYYQRPATVVAAYVVIYVVVTALSLPGAAVMTLVGGAIFGVLWLLNGQKTSFFLPLPSAPHLPSSCPAGC